MYTLIVSSFSNLKDLIAKLILVISFLWSTSCQAPYVQTTPATYYSAPTAVSTAVPTGLRPAELLPTLQPQFTPTPHPTPTQVPVVSVYSPNSWRSAIDKTVDELISASGEFEWQISDDEMSAHLRITIQKGGLQAGQRPLFLTVPLTSDWEAVSLEEAEEILDLGHPLVEVKDLSELTPDRKALKVGNFGPFDSGYPLSQLWNVHYQEGFGAAAEKLAEQLRQVDPLEDLILVAAVGDIMLDRALGYAIRNGQIHFPFERVSEVLSAADFTLGNLESSMGDTGEPEGKSYTFQAPPDAAESLAKAGFDLVSLANNHAMDFGSDALLQAVDLLDSVGINSIGAGLDLEQASAPYLFDQNDITTAFLAYVDVPVEGSGFDTSSWTAGPGNPGVNWASVNQIEKDVESASLIADNTVIILHSGYEYVAQPSPNQIEAARSAIDAGASLVIGHHAHVLQGIEFYNGGVIVYGLGNFAFEIDGDPSSAILYAWMDEQGVRQIEIIPTIVQFGGQPRLATVPERVEILTRVYRLTDLLNAGQ